MKRWEDSLEDHLLAEILASRHDFSNPSAPGSARQGDGEARRRAPADESRRNVPKGRPTQEQGGSGARGEDADEANEKVAEAAEREFKALEAEAEERQAEKERAEKQRAEKRRAEKRRAEKLRAEKGRAEGDRTKKERAEVFRRHLRLCEQFDLVTKFTLENPVEFCSIPWPLLIPPASETGQT
ncbi:hypothetical protein A0H81_02845 [Grifola frondosa]|uniref:Uncharacterized protein n=1 Tax=Grifola frondosa TaxID=5627 RepID=A0A1C7MK82_GRIFR|nr:hypothetical protein A0H81_02845 [Grifola frondosa]